MMANAENVPSSARRTFSRYGVKEKRLRDSPRPRKQEENGEKRQASAPAVTRPARADLGDPRAQLLGHRDAAEQRRGLLELSSPSFDGVVAVAVHDAVEGVEEVLLDRLVRAVADELLGDGADARGEVD